VCVCMCKKYMVNNFFGYSIFLNNYFLDGNHTCKNYQIFINENLFKKHANYAMTRIV